MGMTAQAIEVPGQAPDHEQKRAALGYLTAAWAEARVEGIDGDCLAQACLFAAFAEFVSTYGDAMDARRTCACRKSDSAILVMKAADDRLWCDDAEALNRPMERGILV